MSSFFGSGLMSHCPLQNWKFYICSDATLTHRHTPSLQNKSLRGFLPRRISRDNLCINLILRSFLLPLLCGVFLRWVLLARDPVKSRAESSWVRIHFVRGRSVHHWNMKHFYFTLNKREHNKNSENEARRSAMQGFSMFQHIPKLYESIRKAFALIWSNKDFFSATHGVGVGVDLQVLTGRVHEDGQCPCFNLTTLNSFFWVCYSVFPQFGRNCKIVAVWFGGICAPMLRKSSVKGVEKVKLPREPPSPQSTVD